MKKWMFTTGLVLAFATLASAQRYFTRDARVQFNSETPVEKIEAINKSGTAVLDTKTGRMEWKVLIKNFVFEKALMQEHFNENYMESTKYPNATFKGVLTDAGKVDFSKDGTYQVKARGKLTIHGVERSIDVPGTIIVAGNQLKIQTNFSVEPADFDIAIPGVVRDKIAKEIAVSVEAALDPLKRN